MKEYELNLEKTDTCIYIGTINRKGYNEISEALAKIDHRKENIFLCLVTFGGDPDAGYRIGRCLQHHYPGHVSVYAPSFCKSSGTLLSIAANHLIIGNSGELGPLDIQLRKMDEMGEQSSGLDIFKAVNFLEERVLTEFRSYVTEIKYGTGISTKFAADIAANLANSIINPIASQIDPSKIGEHQRAIGIAQAYGERLNEMTKSLEDGALDKLIGHYPSHGFVIDRKEAAKLFKTVYQPSINILQFFQEIQLCFSSYQMIGSNDPIAGVYSPAPPNEQNQTQDEHHEHAPQPPKNDDHVQQSEGGSNETHSRNPKRHSEKRNKSS